MSAKSYLKGAVLVGGTAGVTALVNHYTNKAATSGNLLGNTEGSTYRWRGIDIYYKTAGKSGTPVLLLHDLIPEASSEEWDSIVNLLAKAHKVYLPDLPGCGRSGKPEITYTNYFYVEMIQAFIKSVITRKCHIVASVNSVPAALFAAVYDSRKVISLSLINPPSPGKLAANPNKRTGTAMRILNAPLVGPLVYNILYSKSSIRKNYAEKTAGGNAAARETSASLAYESAHLDSGNGRFLKASIAGRYLNFDIRHALRTLKTDSVLVYGSDLADAEASVHEWLALRSDLDVSSIEHAGLYPHADQPELTAAELLTFMARREGDSVKG